MVFLKKLFNFFNFDLKNNVYYYYIMPFNTKDELYKLLKKENCNHNIEIIKLESLKSAHIYCKIHQLSGQTMGCLIEKYILNNYDMKKNSESSLTGDMCSSNNINIEIKASNGGKDHKNFNYVQIRFNHECRYIFTAYYLHQNNVENEGELFIFSISKNDMKKLVLKYGSYAHGTTNILGDITQEDLDDEFNNKEYAIRPKYNNACWKELLFFRVKDIIV